MRGGAMNLDQMPAGARMDAEIARRVFGHRAFVDEVGAHQFANGEVSEWVPLYSTKLGAAWLVVNHLLTDGWHVDLSVYPTRTYCSVICNRGPCPTHGNPHHNFHGVEDVTASTPSLALCRAALLAVGGPVLGEPPTPGVRQPRRGRVSR